MCDYIDCKYKCNCQIKNKYSNLGGYGSYRQLQNEYMHPNIYKLRFTYPQPTYYPPQDYRTPPICAQTNVKLRSYNNSQQKLPTIPQIKRDQIPKTKPKILIENYNKTKNSNLYRNKINQLKNNRNIKPRKSIRKRGG